MKRVFVISAVVFLILFVLVYVFTCNMYRGTELISFQSGKYSLTKIDDHYSLFCDTTEILAGITNYNIESDGGLYMVSYYGCAVIKTNEFCTVYFKDGSGETNKNYILEDKFEGFSEREQRIFNKIRQGTVLK